MSQSCGEMLPLPYKVETSADHDDDDDDDSHRRHTGERYSKYEIRYGAIPAVNDMVCSAQE